MNMMGDRVRADLFRCPVEDLLALDSGMDSETYVPLELWEDLLKSPAAVGSRGGIRIVEVLPRDLSARFQKFTGHGWVEERYADNLGSPFFYGLSTAVVVKVGGRVTGIHRIDSDVSVPTFVGKLDGEHIERGLGSAVGEELHRGVLPVRVVMHTYGTQFAGDVDDLSLPIVLQERQHGLSDRERADIIGLHDRCDGFQFDLARRAVAHIRYGSVVDEQVKFAELAPNSFGCDDCGSVVVEVNVKKPDIETLRLKLLRGCLA